MVSKNKYLSEEMVYLRECFADLSNQAKESQSGVAYSTDCLPKDVILGLQSDVKSVVESDKTKGLVVEREGHKYWQTRLAGSRLMQKVSDGSVFGVAHAVNEGLTSSVGGIKFNLGRIVGINLMAAKTSGPAHVDGPFLRMTGNLSVGPTYATIIGQGDERVVIESNSSALIVFRSRLRHKFENPHNENSRASISVAVT